MGESFPQDPKTQLMESVKAVFRSWDNPELMYIEGSTIYHPMGNSSKYQEMVYGNMGDDSGTGLHLHESSTGENKLYGEFLMNAQGEDVVAGLELLAD